jgi:hypothetical protein
MIAVVSNEGGEARAVVAEPEDLKRLHAEFRGVGDAAAATALTAAGLGTVDGDDVWLSAAALRAAGDGSPDWLAGFDAMLGYAASKGWASADGELVRAHIVRTAS